MKQYTHAWLSFMAVKRLENACIPANYQKRVNALIAWFRNHRDFVIQGAWYPDSIIKDMASSHVLKYAPDGNSQKKNFKKLPTQFRLYKIGKECEFYKKPYTVESGNLPDRCEAISHSIIDNLKMQEKEDKGSPISPTDNHVATLFFMLSHYIADAHMPLHCDARSFSDGHNIHGKIEKEWDDIVNKCYRVDKEGNRFYYDPQGYPLKKDIHELAEWIENEIINRKFSIGWGSDNDNTWDFMSAITQYSYLTSYKMIPPNFNEDNLDWNTFIALDTGFSFEEYSKAILIDAIDSIAKVWFRVWNKYQKWLN